MVQQRSIPLCIVLTIVTCGIYGIYWLICLVNDLNVVTDDQRGTSGGTVFLLSLITCGIYGLYWFYKAGEKVDMLHQQRGIPGGNTGILYLILCIVGLPIVTYALLQSELNSCAAPPV